MKDQKVILFDLGKVLIDFDHRIAVQRIKQFCSLDEKSIYSLFFDSNVTDKFEKGLISPLDFFEQVKNMLGARIHYEEFVPIWNEIFTHHPGMLEILGLLKDNYNLYLVSNINKLHFEYLKKQFNEYFEFFNHLFLSYEMGLRKPDLMIYKFIINYLKTSPDNIIYTDDRIELITAAKGLGMDAFLFISTVSFKEELYKRGIEFDAVLRK
jgi:putative hydrolase of the HAD superfamily